MSPEFPYMLLPKVPGLPPKVPAEPDDRYRDTGPAPVLEADFRIEQDGLLRLRTATCIVDTGADCSCYPEEWRDWMGGPFVPVDRERRYDRREAGVTVLIPGLPPILTEGVLGTLPDAAQEFGEDVVLLGRRDFLRHLRATFDQPAGTFTLEAA